MAKGQQRSNRETKKPKKAKAPAPVQVGSSRTPSKGSAFNPKPK
jgi:hypothetical protein